MPVRPTHEMHAYEVHARISCMCLIGMHLVGVDLMGVYLIGVYFIGVYLIGMHLIGVHLLWIISLNNLCAKLPRTRIRLALNSHSKSLPRSIPDRVPSILALGLFYPSQTGRTPEG